METKLLTTETFDAEIARGTVLVDFYAEWCGPCGMLAPILEDAAEKHPGIRFFKVNVDEAMPLASRYGIESIPYLLLFRDGAPVANSVGLVSPEALEAFLKA